MMPETIVFIFSSDNSKYLFNTILQSVTLKFGTLV